MKIFIFAVITLSIAVLLMFFTQYYITHTVETLQTSVKTLPSYLYNNKKASEQTLECLDDTVDFWQNRRFRLCLMIRREEFEEIESLLLNLSASVRSGDEGIYLTTLENLKEKLARLKKSESLSIEGIL